MEPGTAEAQSLFLSGQFQSHDGLTLRYREYPGPPHQTLAVICLPGLLRNARDFEALAPHLASRFRVICLDFRGRGQSDYAPDFNSYVPGSYVQDLGALYGALALQEAVLLGTSLGGLVATIFAALWPERITGVVLNDVGPDVDPAGLRRIAGYVGKIAKISTWPDAALAVAVQSGAAYPELEQDDWLRLARQRYEEGPDGRVRPDYDPAIAQAFPLPETTPDSWPFFAQLRGIPLLALRGEVSDILAPATVARMREAVPDLITVEVPGRGHVPLLNEPAALRAIDGFLDGLPAPMPEKVARERRFAGQNFREAMRHAGNPLGRLED